MSERGREREREREREGERGREREREETAYLRSINGAGGAGEEGRAQTNSPRAYLPASRRLPRRPAPGWALAGVFDLGAFHTESHGSRGTGRDGGRPRGSPAPASARPGRTT